VIDEEGNSLGSRTSNRDITMRKHIEERLQRQTHDLAERVKELNCLYQFSKLIETPDISLEEIFQGTVDLIPAAWQYPEITCAKLTINGFVFATENFKETKWKLTGDIPVGSSSTGYVEVFYMEERPEADVGPFLREEQNLLDAIGERLGGAIQRRHAEEALIYRDKRLQSFYDNAAIGIAIADPEGNYQQVNKHYLEMFGYDNEDELFEYTVGEVLHPDDRESTLKAQKGLASGKINFFRDEKRYRRKDGSYFWGDVSVSPIKDIHSEIYAFTAIIVDITERKLAEEALKWSEEKFSKVFMLSPNLMAITSLTDGKIRDVNEGYVKAFGYSRDELIGSQTGELGIWNDPNDREMLISEIKQNGSVHNLEIEVKTKSGEIRTILLSGEVLDIESEDPLIVTMGSDITDRKQVEEKIRRLNEELEQRVVERTAELEATNKELEAFAYSISHDLRAPLRAINSFSNVLKEKYADLLGKEGGDYLDKVVTSTIKMDQLINDLLALSRLGRQEFRRTTTNLTYIAKRVFKDMAAKEPNRDIQLEISDLPLVEVDAKLMEVMLNNLISNAVKFTRGRTPAVIEFGCIYEDEMPTFFLRDNGVGFDMKYAHRLFSPFQRLHTEREFEGTGIGLAIVRRIVNCHGGKVWVEAAMDKGSTFFFTIE
jgi:PAS domain S-box-containing protein